MNDLLIRVLQRELGNRDATDADLAARDAEIEALREEVRLTNEHEHAIMMELSAARDEIADLKRGVVVEIELSEDDWIEASDEMFHPWFNNRGSHNWRDTYPEGITVKRAREACGDDEIRFFRRLRTIPADRELMRLVDELIRWHGLRPLDKRPDHAAVLVGAIKALRAQAKGAEG